MTEVMRDPTSAENSDSAMLPLPARSERNQPEADPWVLTGANKTKNPPKRVIAKAVSISIRYQFAVVIYVRFIGRRRRSANATTASPSVVDNAIDGSGIAAATAISRSVADVPIVPTRVAAPVAKLIVKSDAFPPVGATSDANAVPGRPEISKPDKSEGLNPSAPTVFNMPLFVG